MSPIAKTSWSRRSDQNQGVACGRRTGQPAALRGEMARAITTGWEVGGRNVHHGEQVATVRRPELAWRVGYSLRTEAREADGPAQTEARAGRRADPHNRHLVSRKATGQADRDRASFFVFLSDASGKRIRTGGGESRRSATGGRRIEGPPTKKAGG